MISGAVAAALIVAIKKAMTNKPLPEDKIILQQI